MLPSGGDDSASASGQRGAERMAREAPGPEKTERADQEEEEERIAPPRQAAQRRVDDEGGGVDPRVVGEDGSRQRAVTQRDGPRRVRHHPFGESVESQREQCRAAVVLDVDPQLVLSRSQL